MGCSEYKQHLDTDGSFKTCRAMGLFVGTNFSTPMMITLPLKRERERELSLSLKLT